MKKDISSINDDFKFQQYEWPVKRVSWILMGLFLFYGILGGLGDNTGVINNYTAEFPGAHIQYPRFLRVDKDFQLKIFLSKNTRNVSVSINNDYFDKIKITDVVPRPLSMEIRNNRVVYNFTTDSSGVIVFYNDPVSMGTQSLEVELNHQKVNLSQYIYF
jgi:hypothetical protein